MAANDLSLFYPSEEPNREKMANTPALDAGDYRFTACALYQHFAQRGFEFSLRRSRFHARPHAGNTSRWVAEGE
jgi:hypothetical protein